MHARCRRSELGRESDTETGLYYYRARYYDPTEGRFISEDPIHFIAGVNYYGYVDNNPIYWRDALGLMPIGGIATLEPSSRLPGRLKLEGDLDPLCQKGRNFAADAAMLTTSLQTRQAEIVSFLNDPDPSARALGADPGHLIRIENEWEALERCNDNGPDCKPKPKEFPFPVPEAWKRDAKARSQAGATAGAAGILIWLIAHFGWAFAL